MSCYCLKMALVINIYAIGVIIIFKYSCCFHVFFRILLILWHFSKYFRNMKIIFLASFVFTYTTYLSIIWSHIGTDFIMFKPFNIHNSTSCTSKQELELHSSLWLQLPITSTSKQQHWHCRPFPMQLGFGIQAQFNSSSWMPTSKRSLTKFPILKLII